MAQDLLIEIGTEELPPKALPALINSFADHVNKSLVELGLNPGQCRPFATPRRLALIIPQLDEQQADREEQKLGPAVAAAFDADGKPTKAAEGFARSNNTTVEALERVPGDKGERLAFSHVIRGRATQELLVDVIEQALAALPIPKRMRWGANRAEFVRPVKWVALVFGDNVIDAEILGVKAGDTSHGHRFHAPQPFTVNAGNYAEQLRENHVIADFAERRSIILDQIKAEAESLGGRLGDDIDELLDEVTALVEWPVALSGQFAADFLDVPAEALVSSMVEHQKYFHVLDSHGGLMPNFITVANIDSEQPHLVVMGNEKVIRPRLTDAAFFFETDKKTSLASRCESLKKIVFQQKLGTVYDKTCRISQLAGFIAEQIGADKTQAQRAGQLAKSDLVSEMVLEFTDLQGLMGYHYALNDGEDEAVAIAIRDQYFPAGNNERMPANAIGQALALADRIDTLVGIFAIGQQPTGNRDPFALRRATLGILRIILHAGLDLDLAELYRFALRQYENLPESAVEQALAYTMERFRALYQEKGYATEVYLAVAAKNLSRPLDFDRRADAVHRFSQQPEADELAAANKRVANILAKQAQHVNADVDPALLQEQAEKALHQALKDKTPVLKQAENDGDYTEALVLLAAMKPQIDAFFDQVMVMADDPALQQNRLALLGQLRQNFTRVADLSLLARK